MDINQGDVFIVPFFPHQEDKHAGEPRWVIVLEDLGKVFSIVPMTSELKQESKYLKTIRIDQLSPEGIAMQLEADSIIILDRELSLPEFSFKEKYKRGKCPEELIDRIIEML